MADKNRKIMAVYSVAVPRRSDCEQASMHTQYVGRCMFVIVCSQSGNPPAVSTQALVPGFLAPELQNWQLTNS